jgi:hypothetical protein
LGEDECRLDDGDLAEAGGEVTECVLASGEDDESAFAQAAHVSRIGGADQSSP